MICCAMIGILKDSYDMSYEGWTALVGGGLFTITSWLYEISHISLNLKHAPEEVLI